MNPPAIVAAVVPVLLVTLLIGARGVAAMRTTSDFLVASRRISPTVNAAAVSGEYLSAASFLGIAGLVVKDGVGSLWYPVGFTAGYVAMLTLVAAPMRRTGALTVPDFADARLGSAPLRKLSAVVVLVIGCLYLVPQFAAAGQVLGLVSGTPYWVGVVLAGAAVSTTLALGGMRAATYVQAFQFVLKLVLFIVPALWLVLAVGPDTRREALTPVEFTRFERATPVQFRLETTFTVTEPTRVSVAGGSTQLLAPGRYVAEAGSTWVFDDGAAVPQVGGGPPGGPGWARPLLDPSDSGHPLLATWSVLVATALGTMGLPHILIRFHTSADGRGARRTAAITVALLGAFYLFPGVYGLLGAVLLPELYLSGATDTVVARCRPRSTRARSGRCSRRCSPRVRSRPSWPPRSGCCWPCPERSRTTWCPAPCAGCVSPRWLRQVRSCSSPCPRPASTSECWSRRRSRSPRPPSARSWFWASGGGG